VNTAGKLARDREMIALDATIDLDQPFGQSAIPETGAEDEIASTNESHHTNDDKNSTLGNLHS
jgi:hypothetical protein